MNTLEVSKQIVILGERKETLENMQKVVGDYYTKNVSLCADINSSMHNKKYHGELVVIDKDCFYKYLGEEIDRLNGEIKTLIERLHGGL